MTSPSDAPALLLREESRGVRAHGRRRPPWVMPTVTGAVVAGATVLLAVHSPYQGGSYGWCPVVAVTGAWCPACGGLRAVHDLTQGDVGAAWGMNAPVVALLPVVALAWVVWLVAAVRRRPVPLRAPSWVAWSLLAGAAVFTVLRNTAALAPVLAPGGELPAFLG